MGRLWSDLDPINIVLIIFAIHTWRRSPGIVEQLRCRKRRLKLKLMSAPDGRKKLSCWQVCRFKIVILFMEKETSPDRRTINSASFFARKLFPTWSFQSDYNHNHNHLNCVTRAPSLYFIRSWVALSFIVHNCTIFLLPLDVRNI